VFTAWQTWRSPERDTAHARTDASRPSRPPEPGRITTNTGPPRSRPPPATRTTPFEPPGPDPLVVAAESGTGALVEATIGAYTVGEQTLAEDLLPGFTAEMLVLADRNFLSHTLARDTLATGAYILWRASASFALRPVQVLEDGTYLARLRPARKPDEPSVTTIHRRIELHPLQPS
jgi:hypothetical protein